MTQRDPRLEGWNTVREIMFQFHRKSGIGGNIFFKNTRASERDLMLSFWDHEGDICIAFESTTRALFILRKNGTLYPTKFARGRSKEEKTQLWECLVALRQKPFETLTASGRSTGVCCVCGALLTNDESVALGIGPICGGRIQKVITSHEAMQQTTLDIFK